jgi:hypothetical protein
MEISSSIGPASISLFIIPSARNHPSFALKVTDTLPLLPLSLKVMHASFPSLARLLQKGAVGE